MTKLDSTKYIVQDKQEAIVKGFLRIYPKYRVVTMNKHQNVTGKSVALLDEYLTTKTTLKDICRFLKVVAKNDGLLSIKVGDKAFMGKIDSIKSVSGNYAIHFKNSSTEPLILPTELKRSAIGLNFIPAKNEHEQKLVYCGFSIECKPSRQSSKVQPVKIMSEV